MKSIPAGRTGPALLLGAALFALSACSQEVPQQAPPPAEVSVVRVTPQTVQFSDEMPGRVLAYRTAEIRPQVNGIIQRRLFEHGSEVRAGQALFQIEPGPFSADVSAAAASVQRAEAVAARARAHERRLQPLVKADAISGQVYDDAAAASAQAGAELAQSRAELQRRKVDLGFATVRSPISGRIDQAAFTEGALASVGSTMPLATVQQIDRVYVDVRQPAARLEALRAAAGDSAKPGDPRGEVEIVASDGRALPVKGRLLFSGISVDPGTGDIITRIEVPNPGRQLLPGMFVRARLPRLSHVDALVLPAQAIGRSAAGKAQVHVVDSAGKVQTRPILAGDEREGRVLVLDGLKPGETVIVEGQDRLTGPDAVVKPMPWKQAAATR